MKVTLETLKEGASKTGSYIKRGVKSAYNSIKEANEDLSKNVGTIRAEIRECREVGKVFKDGVKDDAVLEQLWPASRGIEDYARANNINIIFHTPQKPYEAGSQDFGKPLTITAFKKGFINSYESVRTIDGDVSNISKVITEKEVKIGDTTRKVKSSTEDTFLRRVYRNISEMTEEINAKRKENAENSFGGIVNDELREEIKASNKQIRDGIKDFVKMFIPGKK